MNITINGNDHTLEQIETIEDMLAQLGLGEKLVIVEQNRVIIDRGAYGQTVVRIMTHLKSFISSEEDKHAKNWRKNI